MTTRFPFGSNFHGRVGLSHRGAIVASACLAFLAVSLGSASADDITSIVPDTIGADTTPIIRFNGAVPSPTTLVAFAPPGSCSSARVGETALGSTDTAPLGEAITVPGAYKVCYSVNSGVSWFEQQATLTVVRATPASISSISPSAIGADTTPVITFDGAVPTPTTYVAFALSGQCSTNRVGTTPLTSGSDSAALGEPILTAGVYKVCYSVDNGASWFEQTTPQLTVVTATPTSISSISPSSIGAGTTPTITFDGLVPTPTTAIAFAPAGQCDSQRVGTTVLDSSDTGPLGEAIASPGLYSLCFTVDNGVNWAEQTTPRLTVVVAQSTSITTITPSIVGLGTTPVITFDGATPTPTTYVAFAADGQCGSPTQLGVTLLDTSNAAALGTPISSPGTYRVCYSVNGGTTWVQQTGLTLTVIVATPTTISLISPTIIGVDSRPVMTFTGAVATPTTFVAFAPAGQCSSSADRVGTTALDTGDTAPLGEAIPSAGLYTVCLTVDGTTWVEQTTPTLTVIVVTSTSITLISPTIIGVDSRPVITFTGAIPTSTTYVAFAPAGQCGSSAGRVGTTALDTGDTAPLGEAIVSPGLYHVCYTVNGVNWVQQTAPTLTVIVVTSTSITLISPTIIAAGKTPVITFTGATPTSTTRIAFAPAGQCGTPASRVGTTVLDDSDTEPLGEAIVTPGTFHVCYSVNGMNYTEQTAPRLQVTRGDPFVSYQIKAPKKDASGAPLAGNAFPKGWAISIDDTILSALDPSATDNPENFLVKKEKSLLLPAQQSDGAAVDLGGLHYLRYQASSAKESIQPPVGGQLAKPAPHVPRVWSLESDFGSIEVQSSKVAAVLVPANKDPNAPPTAPADATHFLCYQVSALKGRFTEQTPGTCDAAAAVNPLGSCVDDADCGGTASQHTLCLGPAFRKDLQAFFRDQLDDCATDVSGAPSFTGTPVQGTCLHDLNSAVELCNPIDKTAVQPPRETTAVITASTATTSTSLLCYKSGLAKTFENAATAVAASSPLGPVSVGDAVDPKQSKHVARATKTANPLYTAPGNLFPSPRVVDSVKRERVCISADVVAVTPAP